MQTVSIILQQAVALYSFLIFAYVILTWFPNARITHTVRTALSPVVEPFLALFRRAIPPISGVDFSPIIAILVLRILSSFIIRFFN